MLDLGLGGLGRLGALAPGKGVALYRWISGLLHRRLKGDAGTYLTGDDGRPLYGEAN